MSAASQESLILKYLQAGHALTPLEALEKFGCFRLGARIWELKKRHDIHCEMVEQGGKRFARYSLQ